MAISWSGAVLYCTMRRPSQVTSLQGQQRQVSKVADFAISNFRHGCSIRPEARFSTTGPFKRNATEDDDAILSQCHCRVIAATRRPCSDRLPRHRRFRHSPISHRTIDRRLGDITNEGSDRHVLCDLQCLAPSIPPGLIVATRPERQCTDDAPPFRLSWTRWSPLRCPQLLRHQDITPRHPRPSRIFFGSQRKLALAARWMLDRTGPDDVPEHA